MNRTTVGSNQKNENDKQSRLATTIIYQTEKDMNVPNGTQVFETIPAYVEGQENVVASVGKSVALENGEMKKEDGTIVMYDPKLFSVIAKYRTDREEKLKRLAEIEKEEQATVQVGSEIGD